MCYLLHCLGVVFAGDILPLWLTFAAEIAVAWVIWRESETSRRTHFIATTTQDKRNEERGAIYSKYIGFNEPTLEERSQKFVAEMFKDSDFKSKCDRQIELFNGLGVVISPRFSGTKTYVRIFPHAAVYIWIILRPYLEQRRKDAGRFFAEPMLRFAFECSKFLIEEGRSLHIRKADGTDGLTITVADLERARNQLRAELG